MEEYSTPEVIEKAIEAVFREFGGGCLEEGWIRKSSDNIDYANDTGKEMFPQVFIQCGGPYMEDGGTTWAVDIQIDSITWFEDDPTCQLRSRMYRGVEKVFNRLIFPGVTHSEESVFFEEFCKGFIPSFHLGGIVPQNGGLPVFQSGAQVLSYVGTLRFVKDED